MTLEQQVRAVIAEYPDNPKLAAREIVDLCSLHFDHEIQMQELRNQASNVNWPAAFVVLGCLGAFMWVLG